MKKVVLPIVLSMFLVFTMMPTAVFGDAVVSAVGDGDSPADTSVTVKSSIPDEKIEEKVDQANGKASVTVNSDVAGIEDYEGGVNAHAYDGGSASVTVKGDASSEGGNAIFAYSYNLLPGAVDTTATVDVSGDADSKSSGVSAIASGNGATTTVEVGKNVVTKQGESAIYVDALHGGTVSIDVGGSVANKSANGNGLYLYANGEGSSINIAAQNDVIANHTGLDANSIEEGKINVLINGTLHGDVSGINYNCDDIGASVFSNTDITVWKIETGKDGKLFAVNNVVDPSPEDLATIRQHVHYIVRLEQSDGATLSATKAEGQLDPMHGFGTAKSGDRVLLKVDLKPGYKLDGAYNDNGEKVALVQDENGNYYIDVKDGGGICLSVAVSKTKHNISYNLDGGSYNGQIGTITEVYDYGTAIKLLGTPTREGYRFLYWRGSQYDAGADYTVEGDHLFTAVWEKIVPKDNDDSDDVVKTSVTNTKTASKASPATGDESGLVIWISILAVAVIALVYAFVRRREYNK